MADLRQLLIVSSVIHHEVDGKLHAYGPYAREIDIWADLFPEVVIAAPLRRGLPPGDSIAFSRANISVAPQLETGGASLVAKALQVLALPLHVWRLARAMGAADAIQVRCPANLGLVGCLMAPCFRKPRISKYANSWVDYPNEPRSYRWQKRLLRSRWWHAPVLVYGSWPDQPAHIVPFFTSIIDDAQMTRARNAPLRDWSKRPLEILYVGRLSPDKNVDTILRATGALNDDANHLRLTIIGDGACRGELESLARTLGLGDRVTFEGAVPHSRVLDFYARAHAIVLASQSEGWPKALSEAMAFGMVCIGSDRGLIPQMLAEGRGLLVEPRNDHALAAILKVLLSQPTEAAAMAQAAAAWSQRFTLESLRQALGDLLPRWWGINRAQTLSCKASSKS
jgi:glycosyltransferase involved in cell wall biosynthesis